MIQTQEVTCNKVIIPEQCQKDTLITLLRNYGYWSKVTYDFALDEPCFEVEFEDGYGAANVVLTSHDFVGDDWKRMKFYKLPHPDADAEACEVFPKEL